MRLYISADMEGATGVVSPGQVDVKSPLYQFGREMQRHDVEAVVRAALEWGIDSITVNDAHDTMANLSSSDWDFGGKVGLISGNTKMLSMVEGADEADVAFFLCYHAMAGTERAILDHTYSPYVVYELKINGRQVGETGVNAFFCAAMGVPVAMVSGDLALCLEAGSLLGDGLVTCGVKEGVGRYAAKTLVPEVTAGLLAKSAKEALDRTGEGRFSLLDLGGAPYSMELTCCYTAQADCAALVPGTRRISGRTVCAAAEEALELRRCLSAWCAAAGTAEVFI